MCCVIILLDSLFACLFVLCDTVVHNLRSFKVYIPCMLVCFHLVK